MTGHFDSFNILRWVKGIFLPLSLLVLLTGCGNSTASAQTRNAKSVQSAEPGTFALTESDLDAYEKGLANEIALVRAARERGNNATTPEDRAQAAFDEWEGQTIPGGAQAAGLSLERYGKVRRTVNRVLETLDFQGKIAGPLEIDLEHAAPEMKRRLNKDPFSELPPASAAALQAHLNKLLPIWMEYMRLTALNG